MLEYCLGPRRKVQYPIEIEGPGDGDLKALLIGPRGRCQGSKDQLSVFRTVLAEQCETNHSLRSPLAADSGGCPGQALGETEIEDGHGQPGRARQLPRGRRATLACLKPPRRDAKRVVMPPGARCLH